MELNRLCEQLRMKVWHLKVFGKVNGRDNCMLSTGVCIDEGGLIITSTSWDKLKERRYQARRVCDKGFNYTLRLVHMVNSWGVAFLRVQGEEEETFQAANLVRDGTLGEGEQIFSIGHPCNFVYSLVRGEVNFRCIEGVEHPNNYRPCVRMQVNSDITPTHRILSHIWNSNFFERLGSNELMKWERTLEAQLPVIQCSGLCTSPEAVGTPVFNVRGEIVGMQIGDKDGFQFAIHVTWLRLALETFANKEGEEKAQIPHTPGGRKRRAL